MIYNKKFYYLLIIYTIILLFIFNTCNKNKNNKQASELEIINNKIEYYKNKDSLNILKISKQTTKINELVFASSTNKDSLNQLNNFIKEYKKDLKKAGNTIALIKAKLDLQNVTLTNDKTNEIIIIKNDTLPTYHYIIKDELKPITGEFTCNADSFTINSAQINIPINLIYGTENKLFKKSVDYFQVYSDNPYIKINNSYFYQQKKDKGINLNNFKIGYFVGAISIGGLIYLIVK